MLTSNTSKSRGKSRQVNHLEIYETTVGMQEKLYNLSMNLTVVDVLDVLTL